MSSFRVPYPADPERRKALFNQAVAVLSRHGSYEGTADQGTFRGSTPVGDFAGRYHAASGASELEITLTAKPWIVPTHMVEREVRKLFTPT